MCSLADVLHGRICESERGGGVASAAPPLRGESVVARLPVVTLMRGDVDGLDARSVRLEAWRELEAMVDEGLEQTVMDSIIRSIRSPCP